ncbi:WD repeat containing protein [Parasponia andersonii]|uniref:WD repeat containing protein n=1 Tax=Parasponia andersonii TaxID=3476 RepID=A0A2P5E558_PARAD|nr:WD repeat containing protein [Parasponia andersonii]
MPSFPHPGSVTICEINRDLITAENLSDDRANETYGKLLGTVFGSVPFQLDQIVPPPSPELNSEQAMTTGRKGVIATLQEMVNDSLKRLFHPNDVNLLPEVNLQGVSWHQHKHIIAFISGSNQVLVRDYEDSEGKEPCILSNDSQRDVKLLEWRPNGGRTLSVACKQGWDLYLGCLLPWKRGMCEIRCCFLLGNPLQRFRKKIYTATYLASGSFESASFTIWDVAQGVGTPIRRGLGGISMLKWSPTGDYFFSAKFDGTFYLWETNTWTSESWSSTSGFVTGATWDPEGRMILLAFSKSSTLGSIHFASKPPSLDAHLLPVELPEIISLTNSHGIEKIAWDASGERLAISYKGGDDLYRGLIAIYDVRRTPLISASLIGFIRGPGDNPKPISMSFHDKFKQGPLLSVCWSSGFCCTYPLIFRSHILP